MDKKIVWEQFRKPPKDALKKITEGRLRNFSDINPMWRIEAFSEVFGLCGEGWRYNIKEYKIVEIEKEVLIFVFIDLFYQTNAGWSTNVPGVGGAKIARVEKAGQPNERLFIDEEALKKALTDSLGNAMKSIGVAADVYLNNMDGSKYKTCENEEGSAKEEDDKNKNGSNKGNENKQKKKTFDETIGEFSKKLQPQTISNILTKFGCTYEKGKVISRVTLTRKMQETIYHKMVEATKTPAETQEGSEYIAKMLLYKTALGEERMAYELGQIGMETPEDATTEEAQKKTLEHFKGVMETTNE